MKHNLARNTLCKTSSLCGVDRPFLMPRHVSDASLHLFGGKVSYQKIVFVSHVIYDRVVEFFSGHQELVVPDGNVPELLILMDQPHQPLGMLPVLFAITQEYVGIKRRSNLLSQFMPIQYTKVREGMLENDPRMLVFDRVANTIDEYLYGTRQHEILSGANH